MAQLVYLREGKAGKEDAASKKRLAKIGHDNITSMVEKPRAAWIAAGTSTARKARTTSKARTDDRYAKEMAWPANNDKGRNARDDI